IRAAGAGRAGEGAAPARWHRGGHRAVRRHQAERAVAAGRGARRQPSAVTGGGLFGGEAELQRALAPILPVGGAVFAEPLAEPDAARDRSGDEDLLVGRHDAVEGGGAAEGRDAAPADVAIWPAVGNPP